MSVVRENTLVVDFSVLPVRPNAGKVQKFFENEIKLQYSDVKCIQFHNVRNCVFIEMIDNEVALRYQKAHNYKHRFLCAESVFRIPVYVDCEAVTVRVHDLPLAWPQATVMNHMAKYGTVISSRHEKWKHYFPGFLSGVRVLRMRLERAIPSYITIDNETTLVTYENQQKTCRHCGRAAHPKQKCLDVATSNNSTAAAAPLTATPPSEGIFSFTDFPSMNIEQNQPTTSAQSSPVFTGFSAEELQPNVDNQTDEHHNSIVESNDINASTSSSNATTDFIEINNKRRLSKQKENEKKKVCADQCSQMPVQQTDCFNENNSFFQIGNKKFSLRNKSGKGSDLSNK